MAGAPEDHDLIPDRDEDTDSFTARLAKEDIEDIQFFADLWRDMAAVMRVKSTTSWKFSNAHRRIVKLALASMWKRIGEPKRVVGEKERTALKARLIAQAVEATSPSESSPTRKKKQ